MAGASLKGCLADADGVMLVECLGYLPLAGFCMVLSSQTRL